MKTLALVLLALLFAAGCGSAVQNHTAGIRSVALAHRAGFMAVTDARTAALERVAEPHAPGSLERGAAVDAEARRWAPAGSAFDALREALFLWLDAVAVAESEESAWDAVGPIVARVLRLLRDASRIATGLGVDVPAVPDLSGLIGGTL